MKNYGERHHWLVLGVALLSVAASGSTPDPDKLDSLWISDAESLLKVDVDTGNPLLRIPEIKNATAFAVDERGGQVWAFSQGLLHRIELDGSVSLSVPVDPRTTDPAGQALAAPDIAQTKTAICTGQKNVASVPPSLLWSLADVAVDKDGAVWLGLGTRLFKVSPQGNVTLAKDLQELITGVSKAGVDPARVSVSLCQQIRSYSAAGVHIGNIVVSGATSEPAIQDISYDPIDNAVWVVRTDMVRKYVFGGPLLFSNAAVTGMNHVVSDGHGGAWIAGGTKLRHVAPRGPVGPQIVPLPGFGLNEQQIVGLAANERDQSAWVASAKALAHVSLQGQVLKQLTLASLDSGPLSIALALGEYADTIPPDVSITSPLEGSFTKDTTPSLDVRFNDIGQGVKSSTLSVAVNDAPAGVICAHADDRADCVLDSDLSDGSKNVDVTIADHAGNVSQPARVEFTVDTVAPSIIITEPADDFLTNTPSLTIQGSLNEPGSVVIAGTSVPLNASNAFSHSGSLQEGANSFLITAADRAGNTSNHLLLGTLDTFPPGIPNVGLITFSHAQNGNIAVVGAVGSVEPNVRIRVTNLRTGQSVVVQADADGRFRAEIGGQLGDVLTARVLDAADNESEEAQLEVEILLPPDPASVATPLSESGITPFHESTAFLYSGANPIQTGVAPGTIAPVRSAVLRGRVLKRDNTPLPGVTITVKDHPEFGQTLTRPDGRFDMAVNGGGVLVINYAAPAYIPSQRKIETPWRDFISVPDVVMIGLDPVVTTVDFEDATEMQVASSSLVTDGDGARRTVVLVEPDTGAELVMPDGTRVPMSSLNVRATEYTVGANGPKAMPGVLPPTSGYTYAVELSADEALAAGATSVEFTKPVWLYTENFLGFSVGTTIPVGWYDRNQAAWMPADNGRVIKLLEVQGGVAVLDVSGSGSPATAEDYVSLSITNEERGRLASMYPAGQTLWRVPVMHFTPEDCNFPYVPPQDAERPDQPEADPEVDDKEDEPECETGSIVECQNAVLRESIPIAGTQFSLNYRSDRVPGRRVARTMTIPLSGTQVPTSLKRIELHVAIAGQSHSYAYAGAPNRSQEFVWDGLDAYGRPVTDAAIAEVTIRYVYQLIYAENVSSDAFARAWARYAAPGSPLRESLGLSAREMFFEQRYGRLLGAASQDARVQGLGGWTLSEKHAYGPTDRTLYRGDGTNVSSANMNRTVRTIGGLGLGGGIGDGGPALSARFNSPRHMAYGPDGSLFIADLGNSRIRKIGPDRIVNTIAGTASRGFSGDGGAATNAQLSFPNGVAVGPDGSVYIGDTNNHRIRRINAAGVISTIAGTGSTAFNGDDIAATSASLSLPHAVDVALDGSLYIADTGHHRIRRVNPDGYIETIAGTGTSGSSGDGGPAAAARLASPIDIAVASDGSLYIADDGNRRVRKINVSGIIETVAGNGGFSPSGDGYSAIQASLGNPKAIELNADGSFYIGANDTVRLELISKMGLVLC